MGNKVSETLLGLYLPGDYRFAPRRALRYQQLWGKKIHILSFYSAWEKGTGRPDQAGIEALQKRGFLPMITWEPWQLLQSSKNVRPEDQPDFSLSSILSGKYENYIWNWALDLQKIPRPILLRPMHEMNGNWYPWCGKVNGNTPAEYTETWRYLRSIFQKAKNNKVIWVWSPYVHCVPDEPDNDILQYFPGSEEIDWLALDGYNWGTSREWSSWQSFEDIFEKSYDRLTKLVPKKPMMIAEVGCAEDGGDKGSWIEKASLILQKRFSGIKAVVWFNIRKECDWRIESSEKSLISFKRNWNYM